MVLLTPLPAKPGDIPRPVDTSSQVSAPDDTQMGDSSLAEIPAAASPTAETPGPSGCAPPTDAGHLQEEANQVLGGLLATKSSIDVHWWKLVWELGMALCQNNSETTEFIQKAKTLCSTTIKEAKATCTSSVQEAENLCSKTVRTQRLGQPLRQTCFNDSMLSPSSTWKNKLSTRRVRVNLTSSPPVKLPYESAP